MTIFYIKYLTEEKNRPRQKSRELLYNMSISYQLSVTFQWRQKKNTWPSIVTHSKFTSRVKLKKKITAQDSLERDVLSQKSEIMEITKCNEIDCPFQMVYKQRTSQNIRCWYYLFKKATYLIHKQDCSNSIFQILDTKSQKRIKTHFKTGGRNTRSIVCLFRTVITVAFHV